ncbi:MAG: group II intron reverse transcriptase/maturase [Candidatus Melainabacteria bacterium]|nr:group II intron reverse transcriptase/maturase [Candidatus Melainabacteria bacterium]
MNRAKQFEISQTIFRDAFERVKANRGAAGVDNQSIHEFERDLEKNLYKLWNRMSSGTYFPPAVKSVEIPKKDGGKRILGVPTVADRVAQMVVKLYLEPEVEPMFHEDSYGYRPGKSALDAVARARRRCMENGWVLDLDIKGFFDNLDHEIMMKMVKRHTQERWIILYVERWLKAPMQSQDGTLVSRDKGSPQGSVISPLLSNIYLHYAFDAWISTKSGAVRFERYADDIVLHCSSETQAKTMLSLITERFAECKLELHPEKTKIVFCKTSRRSGSYEHEQFDFLGYTFRPRGAKDRHGAIFLGFLPAISNKAAVDIRERIRSWNINEDSHRSLEELAEFINPIMRGWINYYGRFYRSEMEPVFECLDRHLITWAMRKYKPLRRCKKKTRLWFRTLARENRNLFAHWKFGASF